MAKTISEMKEKIVNESSDDSSVVSESSSEDEISNQATVKDEPSEKEGNSTDDDSSSVASSSDEEEEKEDSDKEEASEEEENSDKESVSEEKKEDSDMEEDPVKEEEKQVPVKKKEEKKEKRTKKDVAVKADNKSTTKKPTPTQTKKRPAPDSTQETPKKALKLNDGTSQKPPSAIDNTVYVGQMLLTATVDDVHTFFAECGEIKDIRLMTFPDGQGKGYGYIDFAENEGKIKAKALNGSEWMGRTIKVGDAQPKNTSEKFIEKTTTVFVGNLDSKLKEKDVREAFKKFGDIKAVHIVQKKKHATAFLRYASKKHAANAIREMNTTELHGRKIVLRFSKNNNDNLYKKNK